ncbi:MAG: FtsX-like permease family protein [Deltaproteobacteria bacterium]|nr:FtsX-like permease family protein [Deltaproteobacteria bacterium]
MQLTTMAWRTLMRNKRRSVITAFSVAFGVLLSVTFTASSDYAYTNMINTSAVMGLGHLSVEHPDYQDTPTLDKRLLDAEAVQQRALQTPGVTAAQVRIMGQAMFASGAKSVGGAFIAIDPGQETPAHNIFLRTLVEGQCFSADEEHGVVVGAKMAEKLNLRLGKKLIFTMTDKDGELVSELGRVSGIFKTGDDSVDGAVVLFPLALARKGLGYEPNAASLVAIFLSDHRAAKTIKGKLAGLWAQRPDIGVLTWQESQPDLAGLIAVDRLFNYLLQFLVGLVIAAGIMNTLLMSVMERQWEFGIMMALGMMPGQVVRLVLLESCWLGLLGLALGVIITTPWFLYMARIGIDFSGQIGKDYSAGGVLVDPVMKFRLYRESAMCIAAAVFSLTMVAGIFPAFKAGRTTPVENLKQG